jgi:hypothetical protein
VSERVFFASSVFEWYILWDVSIWKKKIEISPLIQVSGDLFGQLVYTRNQSLIFVFHRDSKDFLGHFANYFSSFLPKFTYIAYKTFWSLNGVFVTNFSSFFCILSLSYLLYMLFHVLLLFLNR